MDDVVAFFVTIGSPALAAYSLQITHLNGYWITASFLDVDYPNSKLIPTALAGFHYIPIKIEYYPPFLQSLIVLPNNDQYWSQLAAASRTRRWTIPLIMSYVLAIFSTILTIADSVSSRTGDIGYSISAIFTFLLPLILGWLHVGCEPEPGHLRNSLAAANRNAWIATGQRDRPARMTAPKAIEFAGSDDVDLARRDEYKPVPTFNYSRAFVTPMIADVILRLMKNASANAKQHIPVKSSSGEVTEWVENDPEGDKILPENRVGTVSEVSEYCKSVLHLSKETQRPIVPLEIQSTDTTKTTLLEDGLITPSRWAPGIWKRVIIASILALGLQWGAAGAAVFIHYIAPPPGLGCRAFSFMMYGVAGTVSFFFFLASSILAHMCRPPPREIPTRTRSRTWQNAGAIVCRWLGKLVAIISAIGILLVCFFQVTGAFDNCYCSSTTFDMGRRSVVFTGINFVADATTLWFWIGGLVAAFFVSVLFGFSMYMGLPPRRY